MGKIAHLREKLDQIQRGTPTPEQAEKARQQALDARFNEVSERLEAALGHLVSVSDKNHSADLKTAVSDVVQAVRDSVSGVLTQISQEMALSHNILADGVDDSTDKVGERLRALQDDINTRLDKIKQVASNIKMPPPTDLTPVLAMLENIKIPDPTEQLKKLEQRKRLYEFRVERNTYNDLIEKIIVVEK